MSAESVFNTFCQSLNALEVSEVNRIVSTHSLSECQSLLITIDSNDILDTHSTKNSDTDQTDRSASLYSYTAVEFKDACSFSSLHSVDQNCAGLDQDTGIQIQITYVEESGSEAAASYEDVISEPAVQMDIIIRKQTVYISAANVFLVQVEHGDLRIILEDHTGNDLVTNFNRLAGCICLNVLTHGNDLTGTFMSQSNRDQSERINLELMSVCTADTAAFNFNKDIIIA